jgi:hypothetical protein
MAYHRDGSDDRAREEESTYSDALGERNRNTPGRTPGELGLDTEEMRERRAVKAASPPAGAAAGAIAGATAGLATGVFGPVGAMVGAIVGALGGTAAGAATGQAADQDLYTAEDDAHYRGLWEALPQRAADQGFDATRVAYQYGHIAARHPDFAGAPFADVEPELARRWPNELRTRAGEWDAVRAYVEDAFSYARSRGAGTRRDSSVVGSAGSAVDPVERDRSRAGLPSTPDPRT